MGYGSLSLYRACNDVVVMTTAACAANDGRLQQRGEFRVLVLVSHASKSEVDVVMIGLNFVILPSNIMIDWELPDTCMRPRTLPNS